jgi:hypothetical protein
VKWEFCHPGLARPQVEDGGHDLQILRGGANISHMESRTADKGSFSSFEIGLGKITHHRKKKKSMLLYVTRGFWRRQIL